MLDRSPNSDHKIFDALNSISRNGDRLVKSNTLQLIDTFFKNCSAGAIGRLVQNQFVLSLSDEFFTRDPRFHRALCGYSMEWVKIAQNNRALTQQFVNWQKDICSYRYKYVMTEKAAKKFTTELTGCLELLMMFNRAMQTAMTTGSRDDPLLDEILPNIHEIHVRIKDLKPTISDKYVKDVISYIEEYCKLCKQAYSDFKQVGTCDLDGLNKIAARGIPQRDGQIKAAAPIKPVAPMPAPSFEPPMPPMPGQPAPMGAPFQEQNIIDFGAPAPVAPMPAQSFEPPMPAPVSPIPAPSFEPPMPAPVSPMPAPSFEPPMPKQAVPQSPYFGAPQVPGNSTPEPQPNLFSPPIQPSYQPPQPAQNPFIPQQSAFQPPMQQSPFIPQQGTFQPPMQQGYGMNQPQQVPGFEAVDDDTVPNDEFMDFLQNISTKH
jgi:hypothetical protein